MKEMISLVKREYWENRIIILYVPLLFLFVFAGNAIFSALSKIKRDLLLDESAKGSTETFAELAVLNKVNILDRTLSEHSAYLIISVWIALGFYFSLTLYQEKKDKSILFWKSMPTSDAKVIMSKLVAGLILAPGILFLCLVFLHLLILTLDSIYGASLGVDVWESYWLPAQLFSRWFAYLVFFFLLGLWFLPFYSWFLAVSAYVRFTPFLWAVGIPFTLLGYEKFWFKGNELSNVLQQHIYPVSLFFQSTPELSVIIDTFMNVEMLVSILMSIVFIVLAILIRRHSDTLE